MVGATFITGGGSGGGASKPQTGTGNPEGVITARSNGDQYLDTVTQILYFNAVAGATTGWQVFQSSPA